jgi:hypothetical protein
MGMKTARTEQAAVRNFGQWVLPDPAMLGVIVTVPRLRSPGKLRASSRGKTGGAGVIHPDWA